MMKSKVIGDEKQEVVLPHLSLHARHFFSFARRGLCEFHFTFSFPLTLLCVVRPARRPVRPVSPLLSAPAASLRTSADVNVDS